MLPMDLLSSEGQLSAPAEMLMMILCSGRAKVAEEHQHFEKPSHLLVPFPSACSKETGPEEMPGCPVLSVFVFAR